MNRSREEYLKMRSSFADAPAMDAPATPADLHLLQQAEKAFGAHLPQGYQPLVQPAETVAAAPQTVDGPLPQAPEIMDKLTAFMRRFLVCSQDQLTVLALWVLHTWCYKAFHVTPCLNVYSSERRTGKTTCLHLLRCLCPDDWYAAAPTPVATIQKTLLRQLVVLLDDRHLTFSSSGRRQVVNFLACGLVNDALYSHYSYRTVSNYNVFSPRALAGQGPLPSALADRSIPICLRPAKPSSVKRIRFAQHEPDYHQLLQWLQGWVNENFNVLSAVHPESSRDELAQLNTHQQNHLEPLLMLADLLGGQWPEQAHSALGRLFRDSGNDKTNQAIQLLYDIREAFRGSVNPERLSTSYLIQFLCELKNRSWAEWNEGKPLNGRTLALLLERFPIFPDKQRTGELGSVRGYARDRFLPFWQESFEDLPEAVCSASEPEHGTATGTADVKQ